MKRNEKEMKENDKKYKEKYCILKKARYNVTRNRTKVSKAQKIKILGVLKGFTGKNERNF